MKIKTIFITALLLVFGLTITAEAKDKPITKDRLPAKAQLFLKEHFADVKIAYVKVDNDYFDKDYDVLFADGSKVEFDKNGDWKDISCKYTGVPKALIPANIKQYVESNHAETKVIKIEKKKRKYEVKLNNGLELDFTLDFKFIGYDD